MRRRFWRGRAARRLLGRAVSPLLIDANALISSGQFFAGAGALEQLARSAEASGRPQAASLFLEAGRARILAGELRTGIGLLKRGLGLLAASGRELRLARASQRIIYELQARGLTAEAQEIAASAGSSALMAPMEAAPSVARRPALPTHCPECGAPVRPDESEWLDEVTAECQYCGSPIRAN